MKTHLHCFICLGALSLFSQSPLSASYSDNPPLFEQTDPTYQLLNNPHPSLSDLIRGLEERSLREPDDAEVWYQLGLSYAKADRIPEAVVSLQKAVTLDTVHVRAWENLGVNLYFDKRPDEALAAFKRATDLGASNPEVWNDYGTILMQKGRLTESSAALDKGFKLTAHSRRLWNSLGILKEKQSDLPGAVDAFNQALQVDPNYTIGWWNLGLAQAKMKNYDAAIMSFQKVVQIDPKLEGGWVNLAITYGNDHQWKEAYSAAQQAQLCKPDYAGAWYCLGHAAFGLRKREEAVADFQKAFDILDTRPFQSEDPQVYGDLLSEYGLAAVVIGHLDDAEQILNKAATLDPNGPRTLAAIGELRLHQKRWAEALDASQKSLDIDPQVSRTWANLGTALFGLNRPPAEPLEAFQKATALQPDFDLAWWGTAKAYEMLHQPADAAQAYRMAVQYNPTLLDAWRRLAVTTSDPAESDKAIAQAIALAPQDASTYLLFGRLQAQRKNWPEAEKIDRRATEIDETNSLAWGLLGQALSVQKKFPEAISADQKAIQYGSNTPPVELAKYWSGLAIAHINQANEKGPTESQAGLDAANHATTLDPANSVYWYEVALCQKGLGHLDEMKVAWAKCQQLGGVPGQMESRTSATWPSSTNSASTPQPPGSVAPTAQDAGPATPPNPQSDQLASANAIKLLIKNHQFDQALAAAQHETDIHPDKSLAWYSLGDVYMAEGRYDDAIPLLTKSTALDPKSGPSWLDLGNCLAARGRIDEAIDALSKSIDVMPNIPNNWKLLSRCYAARRDLVGGEIKVGDLAQAHPDSPFGWWALGDIQMKKGMPAIALTNLQKAVGLKSDYAPIWNDLGMAYGESQQIDKAQDCFNRAIQLQPGFDEALNNLGYTYFMLGQTDKAIDTYKQALQSNPKHTRALFNLTTAYTKENQWDLARQTCQTLAQIDPQTAAKLSQNFPNATSVPAQPSPPTQSSSPTP